MRKLEQFNPIVAQKLNHPVKLVEAVNEYFWRQGVRKNLSNANYRSIFIRHLGTITVSRYKIREEIQQLIDKIRSIRETPWLREVTKRKAEEVMMEVLKQLLIRRNEIAHDYVKAYGVKVRLRPLTLKDYQKTEE